MLSAFSFFRSDKFGTLFCTAIFNTRLVLTFFKSKNVKKMYAFRKNYSPLSEVLSFTYPKLHTGKSWYVDFTSFDPATGTMRRKKYMLDGIPKITDRRKRAQELIESLLKMLRAGWSPWVQANDTRSYTLLEEALQKYEKSLDRLPKLKTRQSYYSRLTVLRESVEIFVPLYAVISHQV